MFLRRPPTKHSTLDAAGMLPTLTEDLQKKIETLLVVIDDLPTPLSLLTTRFQFEKKNHRPGFALPEPPQLISQETFDACLQTILDLDQAIRELFSLANTKKDLKEDARVRKAKIKTGHVKRQIDDLLPDTTLTNLAHQLDLAYSKFEIISAVVINLRKYSGEVDIVFDEDSLMAVHQAISKPVGKNESVWLKGILGDCLHKREQTNAYYKVLLQNYELYNQMRFSKKSKPQSTSTSDSESEATFSRKK